MCQGELSKIWKTRLDVELVILPTWPLLSLGVRAAGAKVKNLEFAASFAWDLKWAEATVKHVYFVSVQIDTQSVCMGL